MTRLAESVARTLPVLRAQPLSDDETVARVLAETAARRRLDLSDMDPKEQAELIASRTVEVLPSVDALREAIETARQAGRGLTVKFGIDPTSADVHLGHTVPMIILSRFQRMGHDTVLIIGDITASIGDPSDRAGDRPLLSADDIRRNLATYADQVAPFFDFDRTTLRHNSEWLAGIRLPELIGILAQIPVSMSLQREDFRARIAAGERLTMSEFIYSVVMAIDSAKINADVELGGVDQLLNMQMGRKVMEIDGQPPQLVVAMPLIEGTDGTGTKMSKSKGNYVALNDPPHDIFGKIMSIPDTLMVPYLRAWSEWTDAEIDVVTARLADRSVHPMDLKRLVAGEAVAALHGVAVAMSERAGFTDQFSRRSFGNVESLPDVDLGAVGEQTVGALLAGELGFTPSISAARRIARQDGLRIVLEDRSGQRSARLDEDAVARPIGEVLAGALGDADVDVTAYLKAGRKIARLTNH